MLKKIGILLLAIFMTLPINHAIVFANASDYEEINGYQANASTYSLGPNSTAYHETKGGLLGGNITISNLATSPGAITITISDTSGILFGSTSLSPGQSVSIMMPAGLNTITITIRTGTAAGIYRYQL